MAGCFVMDPQPRNVHTDATLRTKYNNRLRRAEKYMVEDSKNASIKYVFLRNARSVRRAKRFAPLDDWHRTDRPQEHVTKLSTMSERETGPTNNAKTHASRDRHANFIAEKISCVLLGCCRAAAVVDVDSALHTVLTVDGHKFPVSSGVVYNKTSLHLNRVPISCTCPDWLYRGVNFDATAFVSLSAPLQKNTKGIRHGSHTGSDRVMGAVRGCKHMLAVRELLT